MINLNFNIKRLERLKALLRKTPPRLGIDVEGDIVRMVRIDRNEEGELRIVSYGQSRFDQTNIGAEADFQASLRMFGGGLKKVALGIDHQSLRIRRMVFAKMPDADVLQAIRWNFREQIEGPMEKYIVGFSTVSGNYEENRMGVIAYGISSDAVSELSGKFKHYGLKVISVEPVASALLAVFHASGVLADDKYHACIVFGRQISNFVIMKKNELLFSRPLAGISEESIVSRIFRDLGVSEEMAREMVLNWISEKPVQGKDGDPDVTVRFEASMKHFDSQFVIEIQRSIDAFCILYGIEKIDFIHICGIGSQYPKLASYVSETLRVETKVFNPFEKLMDAHLLTPEVNKVAPLYAVATGLSIP